MEIKIDLTETPVIIPTTGPAKEMISVRKDDSGKTFVRINSSSLQLIQECKRRSFYSLVQGWKAEGESPATLFGSGIHSALEVYYQGAIEDREMPKFETLEMMSYGHKVGGEENDLILRSTRAFLNRSALLAPLPEQDKRSLQNGVWILHNYFKKFLDDPYVAYVDSRGPFVERAFSLVIHNDESTQIEVFGTIDFAFQHVKTGEIIPGDHKTTSALNFGGSSYFDREKPNHQYTIYMMGCREVFNLDVTNFMVNMVEVKAKPKTERGSGPSFPRQVTSRVQDDFDEAKLSIIESVRDYLRCSSEDIWPQGSVNVCNLYGGCQFRAVCAAPKSLRENILTAKFKKEHT